MKLVLMGDLHYSVIDERIEGLFEAREAFYQTFIARFLEIDADAHVSLGDLTNFGLTLEYEEIYRELEKRERNFIHVLGNHDLYAQPREDVLKITGQQRYHSITSDEAIFVFLDTTKEMNPDDWGGWVDEDQLHWFEEIVQQSGTKPMLVFAHHPVYATTKRSDMEKASIDPYIDMWKILNQKEGVGVYFNGHTHVNSIEKQKNWTFVQLASCLDQPAFRVVDITKDEIVVSVMDVLDAEVVNNAPIIYRNIPHYIYRLESDSKIEDRECRISVVPVS